MMGANSHDPDPNALIHELPPAGRRGAQEPEDKMQNSEFWSILPTTALTNSSNAHLSYIRHPIAMKDESNNLCYLHITDVLHVFR